MLLVFVSLKLESLGECISEGGLVLEFRPSSLGAALLKRRLRVQWKNSCMWLPGL